LQAFKVKAFRKFLGSQRSVKKSPKLHHGTTTCERETRLPFGFAIMNPDLLKSPGDLGETIKSLRLSEIICGAFSISCLHILLVIRGTPHDHGDVSAFRAATQPGEKFQSCANGHFDVGKDESRERMAAQMGERSASLQVILGKSTIRDMVHGRVETCFLKGALEKKNVLAAVLHYQEA
jgi:hypothetical protein